MTSQTYLIRRPKNSTSSSVIEPRRIGFGDNISCLSVPDALDGLDAAERQRVYGLLRVEALVAADGSLEVSGDVISVCEMEISSI